MEWDTQEISIDITPGNISGTPLTLGENTKGMLLGIAASPLLLVSIYFYKASPKYFSKEHIISILSYMCSFFLIALGTIWYGIPSVITAFQTLPTINQIFVSSFSSSIENWISIFLSIVSMYLAIIGYLDTSMVQTYSYFALASFFVCLMITFVRIFDKNRVVHQKITQLHISDITCMILCATEAAAIFVALCSFSTSIGIFLPFFAGITSSFFLLPVEKALYYYPATAVIPIFTVFLRIFGWIVSYQMYANGMNIFIAISLFTGIVSSIFPLILT